MTSLKTKVQRIASSSGWQLTDYQDNIKMISFKKILNGSKARINIYLTKMTVATALEHPKQGKTQLYRRNVSLECLGAIFENPRQHTGKGYKTRNYE